MYRVTGKKVSFGKQVALPGAGDSDSSEAHFYLSRLINSLLDRFLLKLNRNIEQDKEF